MSPISCTTCGGASVKVLQQTKCPGGYCGTLLVQPPPAPVMPPQTQLPIPIPYSPPAVYTPTCPYVCRNHNANYCPPYCTNKCCFTGYGKKRGKVVKKGNKATKHKHVGKHTHSSKKHKWRKKKKRSKERKEWNWWITQNYSAQSTYIQSNTIKFLNLFISWWNKQR